MSQPTAGILVPVRTRVNVAGPTLMTTISIHAPFSSDPIRKNMKALVCGLVQLVLDILLRGKGVVDSSFPTERSI